MLVQAGLISFLLGIFRLGFLDVVLSRALLRGFVTAVAVVIMMSVKVSPDNAAQTTDQLQRTTYTHVRPHRPTTSA